MSAESTQRLITAFDDNPGVRPNPYHNIEVYGFCGKMGTGKNYIAEEVFIKYLHPTNTMFVAFADQLKVLCATECGVAIEDLLGNKTAQNRNLLQTKGTEVRARSPDIWIRYLDAFIRLHASRNIKRFIITDIRYHNELKWVKSVGGTVFGIMAPNRNYSRIMHEAKGDPDIADNIRSHQSEVEFDQIVVDCDFIIYNDLDESDTLTRQITHIVNQHGGRSACE